MEKEYYKVLIADDEYWTRMKLCTMIDWSRYSLCCMEPAADGEEVLRRLEQERPDILITDINMPFVNGVELLQRIHDGYPDIITFVVSGYDDFKYVKDTFMAGSINYLVKPVTRIDLVNALAKALEIISGRKADARQRREQQSQILKASSILQDREFSQLLEKRDTAFTPIITMNTDADFAGMSLMLIKIHDMGALSAAYGYDMNLLSWSVKKEIRKCLKSEVPYVFNHVYRPNELSMLMMRPYVPEDVFFVAGHSGTSGEEKKISSRFDEGRVKEFKELFRRKNRAAIEKLVFKKTGLAECVSERWEYLEVKQTVKRILNAVSEATGSSQGSREAAAMEDLISLSDQIIERLNGEDLCAAVRDVIDFGLSLGQDEAAHTVSDIIRSAVAYIDENYFEDLSLTGLAGRFGMESTYFSRTFRRETGENLMVYVTRKRMEKAAAYIRESETSLTEIAFLTGYDDYAYFSRVFRKTYGKSPRDYRHEAKG
ncbi:MAG TPA: hypothetical protein DF613_13975 [Lachnospiraceae bacterium]|nr:hypothetical protein [Lachnospiraceae bacterium]